MANISSYSKSNPWMFGTGADCHIAKYLDKFDEGTCRVNVDIPMINTESGPIRPPGGGTVALQCIVSNGNGMTMNCGDTSFLPRLPIHLHSD